MSNLNLPSGWTETILGTFMDFKNGVNADKDARLYNIVLT